MTKIFPFFKFNFLAKIPYDSACLVIWAKIACVFMD